MRNVFNNKNNKEMVFSFFHECGTKNKVYYTMRNRVSDRGSDPPLRLCCEFGHEVVGNLDLLEFFLDFFTEFKTNHLSHSDKSSGDRLKGAIETWNWKESTLIMGRGSRGGEGGPHEFRKSINSCGRAFFTIPCLCVKPLS